jgi:hypothetical protein
VVKSHLPAEATDIITANMRNAYKNMVGKPEGRDHSGDLVVDVKIILEWS